MATTFHAFPRLPFELRIQIWGLAASPRIVRIRTTQVATCSQRSDYASTTPPAAVMHVCQESRQHAPYEKAFSTTLAGESEVRHIWVNFHEDMICLPDWKVERLAPHDADIRRLRFTVPNGAYGDTFYSYFFRNSDKMMARFTALRELHLAIGEHFSIWGTTVGGPGYGKCPSKNVRFLDLQTGLLLTGPQLETVFNWREQKGGRVYDMDGFDEELQFMLDNETGLNLWELAEID